MATLLEQAQQEKARRDLITQAEQEKARRDLNKFDPAGSGFDIKTFRESGGVPDETGHMGSLDPRTGMLLKGINHPTIHLTLAEEERLGNKIVKKGDRFFSVPKADMDFTIVQAEQEKRRRQAEFFDFTQLPTVDLSKEPIPRFTVPLPTAGADPTTIGPTPGVIARGINPLQTAVGTLSTTVEGTKTFGQAFTQSLAAKPALALKGVTPFTPGEAFGTDKVLNKTSEFLDSLRNPNTRKEIEEKMQGKLFPIHEGDSWADIDPSLLPEVVNSWAANVGDQIPLMLMTLAGKIVGKAAGKPLGAAAATVAGLATGGPDPTDTATVPVIATATAKIVEHLGGAAPLIAIEAGGFLEQAASLGIDKDIAEKYARIYGPGSGAIEYAQVMWNLKAFRRLSAPMRKTILKRVLTEIGGSAFEGVEEFSQQGLENFFLRKAVDEMKVRNPDFKARKPEIFEGGGRAFAIGTGVSVITRGFGRASIVVRDTLSPQAQIEVDAATEDAVSINEPFEGVLEEAARAGDTAATNVDVALAELQAQSVVEAKLAAGTPLTEAERTQFPQIAEQEDQIGRLRATPPPEGVTEASVEAPLAKPPAKVEPEGVKPAEAEEAAEGVPEGVKISDVDIFDSRQGESFGRVVATDKDGNVIGSLEFSDFDDEIAVKFIEVVPGQRRKGIATAMRNKIKEEFPDSKIVRFGDVSTEEGQAFREVQEAKEQAAQPPTEAKPATKVEPVAKPPVPEEKQGEPKVVEGEAVTEKTANDVEEAVAVDVTDPAFPTSTKHDSTKEIRERLGIGQVNSKTRRSDEEAMAEAVKRKISEKATRIADEINADARALSDIEDAGMRVKVAELEIEHEQIMKLISESKDDADTKTLSVEANRIEAEFDNILRALETSGTEAGRALRARKVQIGRDFKLTSVLNRAKAAAGKKLSSARRQLFKQLTEKLAKRVKQIDALQIEVQELTARKTLQRGAKRFTSLSRQQRQTSRGGLTAKVQELLLQGCAN